MVSIYIRMSAIPQDHMTATSLISETLLHAPQSTAIPQENMTATSLICETLLHEPLAVYLLLPVSGDSIHDCGCVVIAYLMAFQIAPYRDRLDHKRA